MCKLKSKDNCVTLLGRENTGRMNCQNIIYCLYAFIIVINLRPPHINGIMAFSDHSFTFYTSDRKEYTSIDGFNSNLTNIYGVRKGLGSGRHLFLIYINGLYGQ